ncbi:MAG TPA: class I SAM-dependent methyltransferase [Methanocella sp.]|nr:class I SAM-dependent methyltransferase [Methanocella sp.]
MSDGVTPGNYDLYECYDAIAGDYEGIYRRDDKVRAAELNVIAAGMCESLRGRRVLEVACGTGFWTGIASREAAHIVALDISPRALAVAQSKALPQEVVEFSIHDAYDLASVHGTYDAGMANFWLSHVPKVRLDGFLEDLHGRLGAGSVVFMADNVYIPGIGGTLLVKRGIEDLFKLRRMPGGGMVEIVKNYYDEGALRSILEPRVDDLQINIGKCYWWVRYRVKSVK